MTEVVDIHLLAVPIELQGRASAHVDALQREFEMIVRGDEDEADHVPARLRALIQQLRDRFGGIGDRPEELLDQARDRGDASIDLSYTAPPEIADACRQLRDLLAEADEYCQAGDLMTLATPPDVVRYREWFLNEFIRQVEGAEPLPWTSFDRGSGQSLDAVLEAGHDDEDDEPGWELTSEGTTLRIRFSGDLDLESAPHLRSLVASAAQAPDLTLLTLDLTGVTFLDSVGLSVLLAVRMRLVSEEVTVAVLASPAVERVFELAGVSELFAA